VGDRDPVVSVHFASAMADALPNGRLRVIPGAAHALIYDEPEKFNGAVVEFLEEVRMRRAAGVEVAAPSAGSE
jgi:pimeloyl-ACP methyl ester carboxylesterase